MSDPTPSLSPRHERFVAEYLKDGNATRAYIRAGYATRGAQPCASRLLRDPRIEAAISAGRQRITAALAVSVERVTLEYAKIAFACVDDFVSTDDDGRLRVDLEKAQKAQRAGIVELRLSNHNKPEQSVILKLGKLQALAALSRQLGREVAKPAPGPTAEDLARLEEENAALRLMEAQQRSEQDRLQRELDAARKALAEAEVKLDRVRYATIEDDELSSWMDEGESSPSPSPEEQEEPLPPIIDEALDPPDPPQPSPRPQPAVMLGMPIQALPAPMRGFHPEGTFVWTDGREHGPGPKAGGFAGP